MNSKADLKAAREAIGKKDFGEAVKACKRVLLWEGENYNAYVCHVATIMFYRMTS